MADVGGAAAGGGGELRPQISVGAVIVVDRSLLLVQRGRGPAIGRWSVPGGRVEPGETLAEAVEREVAEETGLAVSCGRFLGWVERISSDHHFVIMDFAAEPTGTTNPVAGDDAAAATWVRFDDLGGYDLVDGLEPFLREHGILD